MPQWNGREMIQAPPVSASDINFFTDASDKGLGCVFVNKWIILEWKHGWGVYHINIRELFAIWVALFTWGDELVNKQVEIHTDSLSMTLVWKTGTCKDKVVMKLVRALFLFAAKRNINILMKHIPGDRIVAMNEHHVVDSMFRYIVFVHCNYSVRPE